MKAIIPENLASVYDITMPYMFDVRKIRKQLDAELEKLHPCYPGRCAVDYRLKLQSYGQKTAGIHVRAVVMDRFQLADIRKKNSGCTLYLGGRSPYPVFSRGIWKKRVALSAAFLLVVAAIFLTARRFSVPDAVIAEPGDAHGDAIAAVNCVNPGVPEPESDVLLSDGETAEYDNSSDEPAEAEEPENAVKQNDYSLFFRNVYELGGSLASLSWNGPENRLVLKVHGLFPEQIADAAQSFDLISYGPVAYTDLLPDVSVSFASIQRDVMAVSVPDSLLSSTRKLFFDCSGSLSSETVSPPSLTGSIPVTEWSVFATSLFSQLKESTGKNEWPAVAVLQKLVLIRNGEQVDVSLQFSDTQDSGNPLFPVMDLVPLFFDAPGLKYAPQKDEKEQSVKMKDEIGRITREDGTSVVFYHTEEGKIERKTFEN